MLELVCVRRRLVALLALVESTCVELTVVCAVVTGFTCWECDALAGGELAGEVLVRKSRVRRCSCWACSRSLRSRCTERAGVVAAWALARGVPTLTLAEYDGEWWTEVAGRVALGLRCLELL